MSTKLAQITTQYRRFTKNQVLTESHLNGVLDYFDDQDRLSRICLSGVGIVCGFNVSCTEDGTIEITQGSGVTTDGDLFHLYQVDEETATKIIDIEKKTYAHYQAYENDKSPYKPFFYQGNNQIELFELLTDENDDSNALADLEADQGLAIKDAVVLLYLETYEKDQDLCVSLSCDNQGIEIIGNYKVLITSKANAAHIKSFDTTLSETNYEHLYYSLPDLFYNRSIMLNEDFENYPKLKDKFASETFKNDMLNRVKSAYTVLLNGLGLTEVRDIINLKLDDFLGFSPGDVPPDFQYRYDLLKDVIDSYNEIKNLLAIAEASQCCADLKAFPKHLMLGEVEKTTACFQFRHGFYKSPILTNSISTCGDCDPIEVTSTSDHTIPELVIDFEQANLEVCYASETDEQHLLSLLKRVVLQLTNYNANYTFIKTTPSLQLGSLSKKAIPFYYNLGNQLISAWDYEKTIKGKQRNNISYHEGFLKIKQPLKFCIDQDFYRIEGHQGMNYQDVLSILKEIKRVNSLAFNVVALPVNATEAQQVVENYTSYYLSRNVGLEHKAGVTPGGTFIVIYIEGEYDAYPYPYGYGYPYGYPSDGGAPFGGDFEIIPEDGEPQVVLNPVVADFMLPYLCCDENVVELRLPIDTLCFTTETEPLPFEVSPSGGFVSAAVAPGLNGGVFRNDAGHFMFDPNLVSEELHGEPISFRVNNLETECMITVTPQVVFEVGVTSISYDRINNLAHVIFEIIGITIPIEQSFTWNFGDGSPQEDNTTLSVGHTYNLALLETDRVLVTTQAENGDCQTDIATEVIFELIPDIALSETEYCRNDQTPHPFTVVPSDATVLIEGDGVVSNNGAFFFVAANVPDSVSAVSFTVNGHPSGVTVIINEAPSASFTHEINNDILTLSNTSDLAVNYEWVIDGESVIRVNRTDVNRDINNFESNVIDVSLTANSQDCGADTFGPISIRVRPDGLSCIDQGRQFLADSIVRLRDTEAHESFGLVPNQTKNLSKDLIDRFEAIQANADTFLNGERNNQYPEFFEESFLQDLLNSLQNPRTAFDLSVLLQLAELHIKLSYRILGCQEESMLVEFQNEIESVQEAITQFIRTSRNQEIDVDPEDAILGFLQNTAPIFNNIDFIIAQINEQIAAL